MFFVSKCDIIIAVTLFEQGIENPTTVQFQNSQNILRQIYKNFVTLRCVHGVIIHGNG